VKPFSRQQKLIIVDGILAIVGVIALLQLWLLTATMNAFLGGEEGVITPALVGSGVCFLLNLGLLRYIYLMEQR
jgi:hypothetical protein